MAAAELTPAQRRVVVELLEVGQPQSPCDPELATYLRERLERALAPVADALAPETLMLSKRGLGQVHACEAHFAAERDEPFEWSPATARGAIVHRAVGLTLALKEEPVPLDLVDYAICRSSENQYDSLGQYLRTGMRELDRAELAAEANSAVVRFLESWPPLSRRWAPCVEARRTTEACDGRIVLDGRVDLLLWPAGLRGQAVIVDLKTGGRYADHLDDLRFYALVQTLQTGLPPYRVASYYLDLASFHAEDVTAETLESALRRTIDGAHKIANVTLRRRPAAVNPGTRCRYCCVRATCPGGQSWTARLQGDGEAG